MSQLYIVESRTTESNARECRVSGPLLQFAKWQPVDAKERLDDLADLLNRIAAYHYERGRKEMTR